VSPFGRARLLTVERLGLFTRTAELLAEGFEEELGRWLGDVSVSVGSVEQTTLPDLCAGRVGGVTSGDAGAAGGADADADAGAGVGVGGGAGGAGGAGAGVGGGGVDVAVVRSLYQVSHGVVVSDLGLALGVVGLLCGGGGEVEVVSRPLSRLEMGVFDLVLQPLVDLAVGLFGLDAVELGGHVSSVSGLPGAQAEPVVGVPFHLRVSGIEGVVTLGLSASQLQSYSEELDRRVAGQLASRAGVPLPGVVRAVAPVEVELVVGFELLAVPAWELVGLRVGDVLRTNQSVSRPLVARIGGEQLFHIRPAQHGRRLVAELTGHVVHNHLSSTIHPTGPGADAAAGPAAGSGGAGVGGSAGSVGVGSVVGLGVVGGVGCE
jgi:flagellar motor switch protein FliM